MVVMILGSLPARVPITDDNGLAGSGACFGELLGGEDSKRTDTGAAEARKLKKSR